MNQRTLDKLRLLAETKAQDLLEGFERQMLGERVNYGRGSGRSTGGELGTPIEEVDGRAEEADQAQAIINENIQA